MTAFWRVSLQTKILGIVLSLGLLLIFLLTGYYGIIESNQVKENKGQLALELSKTISTLPSVIQAFKTDHPEKELEPLAEKIRKQTGAEFIVIGNKNGVRYSHPDPKQLGKKMVGGDNSKALKDGKYYISEAKGTLGLSIRGKSPIFNHNHIIGIVSVGFLLTDVKHQILIHTVKIFPVSIGAVIISIIGSYLLARNIRKDTLGLEPYEIASLYKEKNAVLHSVKEGILSIDYRGFITSMNAPAKRILEIERSVRKMKIDPFFPSKKMYDVLLSGRAQTDIEMKWKDRSIIVNITPIMNGDIVKGAVASFRDKTEIEQMVNRLSEAVATFPNKIAWTFGSKIWSKTT